MADALAEHLASLPEPFLTRVAKRVLHARPSARSLVERAIVQRLLDVEWVSRTVTGLGPRGLAALRALHDAGAPVVRGDLQALAVGTESDVLEDLEELALIAPVRTGRGMPTHVRITPGLEEVVRQLLAPKEPGGDGPARGGTRLAEDRRRFALALLVGEATQHPPRLTREGRLHAGDVGTIAAALESLGATPRAVERTLNRLQDLGAARVVEGRLVPIALAIQDVPALHLLLATSELALPSLPRVVLAIVDRLVEAGTAIALTVLLDEVRAAVLADRALDDEDRKRGAKRELAEALGVLLALEGVVVLDEDGQPAQAGGEPVLARVAAGAPLAIAIAPDVGTFLRSETLADRRSAKGHVQSSFEIVVDPSCDPSLVARIAAASRLERADRAAVLKLERASVKTAHTRGQRLDTLLAALAEVSGRAVPPNVATVLGDWFGTEPAAPPPDPSLPITVEEWRVEAWRALDEARPR